MQPLLAGPGPRPRQPTHNNLGTINGCYIPCLLNILGAPLFLFVGFAVGMMGWAGALGLFFFSELIAYLTITSFSALVTNGQMKGGGAYYMISRSLGPAFGGSSGMCALRPTLPCPPLTRTARVRYGGAASFGSPTASTSPSTRAPSATRYSRPSSPKSPTAGSRRQHGRGDGSAPIARPACLGDQGVPT